MKEGKIEAPDSIFAYGCGRLLGFERRSLRAVWCAQFAVAFYGLYPRVDRSACARIWDQLFARTHVEYPQHRRRRRNDPGVLASVEFLRRNAGDPALPGGFLGRFYRGSHEDDRDLGNPCCRTRELEIRFITQFCLHNFRVRMLACFERFALGFR
jgi:hypothetical protein